MNDFLVRLPLPPERLHPNQKPHRQERGRLTKKARGMAKILALAALNGGPRPYFPHAAIRAHWGFPTRRRRDEANLQAWLKAYVDGLVDAGIIVDDSSDHLVWLPCEIELSSKPYVILIIHQAVQIKCTPIPPQKPTSTHYAPDTSEPPTFTGEKPKP